MSSAAECSNACSGQGYTLKEQELSGGTLRHQHAAVDVRWGVGRRTLRSGLAGLASQVQFSNEASASVTSRGEGRPRVVQQRSDHLFTVLNWLCCRGRRERHSHSMVAGGLLEMS